MVKTNLNIENLQKELYKYKGTINRVVDGDTMDISVDLGFGITIDQRFRIKDFDAPETWRPRNELEKEHGKQATDRAKELLVDKTIYMESSKVPGIYGRYSASIWLDDGRNFADVMISEGFQKKEKY